MRYLQIERVFVAALSPWAKSKTRKECTEEFNAKTTPKRMRPIVTI